MLRLIKSEVLKGYMFLKLILLVLWIAIVRFFILLFIIPGKLATSLDDGKLGYIIFAVTLFVVLSIWGTRYVFSGFRCVPYWGGKFWHLNLLDSCKEKFLKQ